MADKSKMDPNFLDLTRAFFEAGLNVGLGHVVDPDDLNILFDRFILINDPTLEKVRLYRA